MHTAILEKKIFPREVLCGEFLSHEVVGAFTEFGIKDQFLSLHPNAVSSFRLYPQRGKPIEQELGFEAFALKRSVLDQFLLTTARDFGAVLFQPAECLTIRHNDDSYEMTVTTGEGQSTIVSKYVIAAYGKQNILDKRLNRNFTGIHSGFTGIKYHIPTSTLKDPEPSRIQLYTSPGIYCGVNAVSENETTLCFLYDGSKFAFDPQEAFSSLSVQNKSFSSLFGQKTPETIRKSRLYGTGNIFFGKRNLVEEGIYMIGDAAAVIAPLAGDGIGMAIESGKLAARTIHHAIQHQWSKKNAEEFYMKEWDRLFRKRLSFAMFLQRAALDSTGGTIGMRVLQLFPSLTGSLIKRTRSK